MQITERTERQTDRQMDRQTQEERQTDNMWVHKEAMKKSVQDQLAEMVINGYDK